MGGHYGSIQVRTSDRAMVKAAAEAVATARNIRCLVGPELNGWVGVYPEGNGKQDLIGTAIAELIDADVLQLLVHDDDVLAYWLWREHELVGSYWSTPGILGDENIEEEEKRCGDAEQFRAIIGDKVRRLAKVLDRSIEYTFEGEPLSKLAKVLGISNAVTEYDYLVSDERDGIKGWRKFEKIPTPELVAAKPKGESSKAIRKRLHKSGLLVYSHEWKELPCLPKGFPMGGGFILGWVNPWQESSELTELLPPQYVAQPLPFDRNKFAAHVQGDLAVIGANDMLRIMDKSASPWKLIAELPQIDQVDFSAISPKGEFVAHSNAIKIIIRKVPSGERVWEFKRGSGRMAFHPTEKWLVVSNSCLGLICLDDAGVVDLFVGGNKSFVVDNVRVIEEPGCLGFSRDGRLFWCGTNVGLRIYEWESLSSQSSRKPRWLLRLHDKLPSFVAKQVTAIAEEPDSTGIVFGTFAGKLARFGLETGELHKLADLPGGGEIEKLMFSADGTMLAVGSDKETRKGPRSMPNHARAWEIWDYKKLRDAEVLLGRAEKKLPATSTEDSPEDWPRWRRASAKSDRSRPIHRRPTKGSNSQADPA